LLDLVDHLQLRQDVHCIGLAVVLQEEGDEVRGEVGDIVGRLVVVHAVLVLSSYLECQVAHVFVAP
jgi:hypothetical protein